MESYIEELDILPGFREGIRNVALDEQRHIAFGVKLLADLYADDPQGTQDAIVETIREVGPYTSAIAMPPGWDETYYTVLRLHATTSWGSRARARSSSGSRRSAWTSSRSRASRSRWTSRSRSAHAAGACCWRRTSPARTARRSATPRRSRRCSTSCAARPIRAR